jgi:hypothetical protein
MTIRKKTQWSKTVWTITVVATAVISYAEYTVISGLYKSFDRLWLFVAVALPAIMIYFAISSPLYVESGYKAVILKKIVGSISIDFQNISEVKPFDTGLMDLRLFGSGGYFGYVGSFRNSKIGNYRSFVGDYSQAFIIQTKDDKKFVFSCEDRDEVIGVIKAKLK